jgi:hypothetical protein
MYLQNRAIEGVQNDILKMKIFKYLLERKKNKHEIDFE